MRGVCYIVIVSEKASKVSGKIRHNIRDLSEDVHCLGNNTEVKVVMVVQVVAQIITAGQVLLFQVVQVIHHQ